MAPIDYLFSLVISLAIILKAYWISTTETNPDEIWGSKKLLKMEITGQSILKEEVGDSITFKGILEDCTKFEVYKNDTICSRVKYSEGI